MPSRFHADALRRLGIEYTPDPRAARALERRGASLGIRVPASFAEWYGMRDGIALLREHSNCDEPLEIGELGKAYEWRWAEARDWVKDGLLLFMFENQAVCVWAIDLNGGEDPPVVIASDPDLEWRPCAPNFSTFIWTQVWDHRELWSDGEPGGLRVLLQAQDQPLGAEDLRFLRERWAEQPVTRGWPGTRQLRFERGDARILIWDGEDQADWFLCAPTEASLTDAATELWGCGGLRESFWSNDERGERLLRGWRERGGPGGAMRFVKLSEPIATADASSVELRLHEDNLEVRFLDWQGQAVQLPFPETAAFRWDPRDLDGVPRDDTAYEVIDSVWIAALAEAGQIERGAGYRHYKLCFNAACVLDVLSRTMRIQPR